MSISGNYALDRLFEYFTYTEIEKIFKESELDTNSYSFSLCVSFLIVGKFAKPG